MLHFGYYVSITPLYWLDAIVISALLIGIGSSILALCTRVGPQKGKRRLTAACLIAASLFLGACDSIWTRQVAPRASTRGTIISLEKHGGKDPISYLTIQGDSGDRTPRLSIASGASDLEIGQKVHVDWMIFDRVILHLNILAGPNAGDIFQEVVPFDSLLELALAIWIVWVFLRSWRKNPNAEEVATPKKSSYGNDVDEQSLLHLNK